VPCFGVFLGAFSYFVWFWVFVRCLSVLHGDSSMDYASILFSSFSMHSVAITDIATIDSVNLQNRILSGLISDLARAIWRWTEKKEFEELFLFSEASLGDLVA